MARTAGSHSDITGPRIEQVALSLFARHGYAAVSMRQIAAGVGVQVGALYNYIPDKQTLLSKLMVQHMQALLSAYSVDATQPASARLKQFVEFHIRYHHERPDAVFIAYMELRNLTPENFDMVEALRREYETLLEEILIDGVRNDRFHIGDTKVATRALIAMLTGITTWFRDEGRLSLSDVQNEYWVLVRQSVGAD